MDRRRFLSTSATAGAALMAARLVRGTEANSAIRVGLLGCGNRGMAHASALLGAVGTSAGARITALGDLFADQLAAGRAQLDRLAATRGIAALDPRQLFLGPDAFERLAASPEVDAVWIATPPCFHPQHLAAAVAAGKHVYCEKPVAVDLAGIAAVGKTAQAVGGRVSADVGFQLRSAPPFAALQQRIRAGALGGIISGEAHYFATDPGRAVSQAANPVERRVRNWIYERALSGDIIVEQNIHVLDLCNWYLNARPLRAEGRAWRAGRRDPGDCNSAYQVRFDYPGQVSISFSSTQFGSGAWDVSERLFGDDGRSESPYSGPVAITGKNAWQWGVSTGAGKQLSNADIAAGRFTDNLAAADTEKHRAFLDSIRSGAFHNQLQAGIESTLTAMLGRVAAGREGTAVSWEEMLAHPDFSAPALDLRSLAG